MNCLVDLVSWERERDEHNSCFVLKTTFGILSFTIRWFDSDDSSLGRFIVVLWDSTGNFIPNQSQRRNIRTINFYGRIGSWSWDLSGENNNPQLFTLETTSGPIKQKQKKGRRRGAWRETWSDLIRQQKFPSEFSGWKKVRGERRRSITESLSKLE